jgi:hypothetical protein
VLLLDVRSLALNRLYAKCSEVWHWHVHRFAYSWWQRDTLWALLGNTLCSNILSFSSVYKAHDGSMMKCTMEKIRYWLSKLNEISGCKLCEGGISIDIEVSGIILDIQLVSQHVTDIFWGCQGSLQPRLLGFMTLEITCVLKVSWEHFTDHQHICALIIGCFHTQDSEWLPRSHNTPKTFVRESCWHRGAAEAWTSPDNFWAATWWGILDVTPCSGWLHSYLSCIARYLGEKWQECFIICL